jgi:hypothetical protein
MATNLVVGGAYNLVYNVLIRIGGSLNKVVPVS